RCSSNAERDCDYRDESEAWRFPGLAQREREIVHVIRCAMLGLDQRVWHDGPGADMQSTQSLQEKWARPQAEPHCAPKPQTIAKQSSARARMLTRCRSRVL